MKHYSPNQTKRILKEDQVWRNETTQSLAAASSSFLKSGWEAGLLAVAIIVLACLPARAQGGASSTLVGLVTDATGAVVPGAEITVKNVGTGISRTALSNEAGQYTAPSLELGNYEVTASKAGFESVTQSGINLPYEQTKRVDFTLQVGATTQHIEVTAAAPTLNTENAASSTVVNETQVVTLPLNGRNFVQLTHLVPGTTPGAPGNGDTGFDAVGFTVSAFGQRDIANTYTLDGITMTETRDALPVFRPSIDAIQEFNVQAGLYSAEYGLRSGAHVDVALKSGTNQLHGDGYEFLRNSVFDSRNLFSPSIEPLKLNQFGGTIGGPIRKDKTFFFAAYDGTRTHSSGVQTGIVPDPQQLKGDFSALSTPIINPATGLPFPGNIIPPGDIDKDAAIIAPYFPPPNEPGQVPNLVTNPLGTDNTDQVFGRIDHRISERDNLFGRYAYSNRELLQPSNIPPFATANPFRGQQVTLQETHVFNPQTVNQVQLGYFRYNRGIKSSQRYITVANQLAIQGVDQDPIMLGFPYISITGYSGIGQGAYDPLLFLNEHKEIKDTLSTIHGNHSIKIGTDITRIRNQQIFPQFPRGEFSFTGYLTGNPLADFLLGRAQTTTGSTGFSPARAYTTLYHFFATDEWKATRRLTLNFGLRYELDPPVQDQRGNARNFDPATGLQFPTSNIRERLFNFDKRDLAPRFSFAYRPFGGTQTVVRGGYGLFYNLPEFAPSVDLNFNPPFTIISYFEATPQIPLTIENPFPSTAGVPAGALGLIAMDKNFRTAMESLWTLSVGRQLAHNLSLEVGYTGSRTTHLLMTNSLNTPVPGPGDVQARRPYPQWSSISYSSPLGYSTYEGLTVKVEKRYSQGLFFLASYTWSHALDLQTSALFGDGLTGGAQNPRDLFAEYASAGYDLRHVLSVSYGYELPVGKGKPYLSTMGSVANGFIGGWQVNGITSIHSGPPFSPGVPGDPANIGSGVRPDRICDGNSGAPRTLAEWFNTGCFVAPPPYSFGNSARDPLTAPGVVNFDFSLFKNFPFGEHRRVEFRAEFFNLFNHPPLGVPGQYLGTPSFGVITYAGTARQGQLALKIYF